MKTMDNQSPGVVDFFQNEAVFRTLIDHAPVGMIVFDSSGKFRYVNHTFTDLLGYTLDDVPDLDAWWQKAHPDADYRRFVQQAWQSASTETPMEKNISGVFRIRCTDGKDRDIEFGLAPMSGDCQLATLSDVTARVRAKAELRASEQRFHSLYNAMTEGVALHQLVYDEAGKPIDYLILDVNPAYEEQTGVARLDVVGRKASEAYGTGAPPYLDVYAKVAATGQPARFETHFEPMNRTFAISVFSPDKDQFATVFEDVSAHIRAEQEIEKELAFRDSLIESIPGVFYALNATGGFIAFNNNLLLTSELSAEEMRRTNALDLFSEEDKPRVGTEIARTFVHGSGQVEARLVARSGRTTPFSFTGRRIEFHGAPILVGTGIDISGRLQAEDERTKAFAEIEVQQNVMRDLLAINQTVLQNALVGIVYLKNRVILSCNKRAESIFGYAPGELIGRTTECFYASEEEFVRIGVDAYAGLAHEGATYSEELLLRHKDGHLFWGALNGQAVDWRKPQEGSIWIYADISERRVAELESEKLRTAVEQAPVSIVITDRYGNIDYVNPSFTRITGYAASEVLGANPRILKTDTTPPAVYQNLWQTVLAGKIWRGTLSNRCKDGRIIWEDTSISSIRNSEDAITHFIAVKEDVTERRLAEENLRESEAVFRHLFEGVNDPLLLIHDGRFVDCNTAAYQLLGYGSKGEFLNRRPADISPEHQPDGRYSAEKADDILAKAFDVGSQRFEWVHLRADGSEIFVEVTLTPIVLRGESIIHTSWRDISERKRIEAQLEAHQNQLESLVRQRTAQLSAALEEAQAADRTKDEFLANISHELRTPLSAMIGFSNLARPLSTTDQQRDYLAKISGAGQTLSHIINDLLDLSKIAAGRMELESGSFSLRKLIARCHSVTAWKAEEKRLNLVESVDPAVPDVLLGDPLRIEQIIINLLSNAIKFTAEGGVALHVSLRARHAGRLCVQIRVDDTGIGIAEEQIASLFKPFSQTDASISRRFGGTGLGLAICKRLVELMDGSINVKSTVGVGSSFRVTLWFREGNPDEIVQLDTEPADREARSVRYTNVRVLVVDDQPLNREVVTGLLRVVGVDTDTAENGQEAIDMLTPVGPAYYDLVLMDVQMPILDGLSATREMRSRSEFAELPIIAMTAHTMAHEREKARLAGMNDHIGKPFDEVGFYSTLSRWIAPAKQRHEISKPPLESPSDTEATPKTFTASAIPTMAGIDTQSGLALLLGNVDRYCHWLLNFVTEAPAYLAQMRQALTDGDLDAAASVAHSLKGRAGMLGMISLHEKLTRLNTDLDARLDVAPQLPEIAQDVAALAAEISAALGALGAVSAENITAPSVANGVDDIRLPAGPVPAAVQRLMSLLEAGDSDSEAALEIALEACVADPHEAEWAPHLRAVTADVRRFDFVAARKRLSRREV